MKLMKLLFKLLLVNILVGTQIHFCLNMCIILCNGNSPVLEFQRGMTYTFIQHNISNWMHPLGLAYYPDGHHGDLIRGDVPVPVSKTRIM